MRFGLIGAGAIGKIRADALALSPVCELVAVSDLDEPRARAAAPGAIYYADANDLIAAPDVDAIIISTPPPLHEPLAAAAAAAGKHVLVEKPMAATPEACERMILAARKTGTLLTVGYNHRYFEALKLVRDVVQSGDIGTLTHVRAYTGHAGLAEFKAPWMYDKDVMGGGALMDNGTHVIDLVRYIMGDPTEVFGFATSNVWKLGVEDEGIALLRTSEGVRASIEASWHEWRGYRFHIEAYGDRGMARAYYAPMMATVVRLDKPGGSKSVKRHFYPKAIFRERVKGWQSTVIQTFLEELSDFVAAARGEKHSGRLAVAADGLRAVQIARATYESEKSRNCVTLPALP
ncbi:MAG: Gfo/Idh/MocA family oxidoreductase [Sphingomonas sp.]|nr:Gfo/Idh/MocA family oxidoreductase [Sphingomonas sp.]